MDTKRLFNDIYEYIDTSNSDLSNWEKLTTAFGVTEGVMISMRRVGEDLWEGKREIDLKKEWYLEVNRRLE